MRRTGWEAWGWLEVGSQEQPSRPWLPRLLPTLRCPQGAEPSSPRGSWAFSVSLGELKSIRRSKPGLSWAYLVLVTQLEQLQRQGLLSLQKLWFYIQPAMRSLDILASLGAARAGVLSLHCSRSREPGCVASWGVSWCVGGRQGAVRGVARKCSLRV